MPRRRSRLILCSGKGGVGKSTVASAIATYFAGEGERTMIVSSDPVQALSRIFGRNIGDKVTKLSANLEAMEIDVDRIARKVETEYKKIFVDALASWVDGETAKALPLEILSGVNELLALDRIRHFVEGGKYEVVVWDTAPTAHTLRLLRLSKRMSDAFTKKFGLVYRLLHPLQTLKSLLGGPKPKLLGALEGLGKMVEKTETMLADPRTELILIINPEKLSIFEGKQLREAAETHGITIKRAVVNKMLLPCKCKFCSMKREEQEQNLELIKHEYRDLKLLSMPFLPYEILSKERVKEYAEKLFAED
jgi:arsenite-transporting ATPase